MYYSASLLENSARSPCSESRLCPSLLLLLLHGTRAHFSLKTAKGSPPLFFLSLSLSLTARHYSLLLACVMRAGQNGIADKSWGTGRRGRSDKVRLDIRAVREQQSLFSLFFFFSYAFSWLEDSSSSFYGPTHFWLFEISVGTRRKSALRRPTEDGRKENRVQRASEEGKEALRITFKSTFDLLFSSSPLL